jgi:dihydrofolate synthase/folylpolyglutamate synthase
LQAALLLGHEFSDQQLAAALQQATPRGRCERHIRGGCEYVFDVAHNPAAVNNLVEYLSLYPCNGKTISIFSVMEDKDIRGMLQAASSAFDSWLLADQPANPRAARALDIAPILRSQGQLAVSIASSLADAFRRSRDSMVTGDRLVVFGSFYTVAEVLPLLDADATAGEA